MYTGRIVFAQLTDLLPLHEFHKCAERYQGNSKVQNFSCLDQFLCMAFAQLTYRESLRDIESCLRAMKSRLYHMGIRGRISRSTLADANENRDWRIYADFAQVLIGMARSLYLNEDFGVQLKETAYAFDSTAIDLCLELFPWARFRKTKGAIKLYTLLNLRGSIPEFIHITEGRVCARRQYPGPASDRSGLLLRNGPGLPELRKALYHPSVFRLLCDKSQKNWPPNSFYTILQALSLSQFEKEPFQYLLSQENYQIHVNTKDSHQLLLFNP